MTEINDKNCNPFVVVYGGKKYECHEPIDGTSLRMGDCVSCAICMYSKPQEVNSGNN